MDDVLKGRWELPKLLEDVSVGLELGVATGNFSRCLLDSGKFIEFWCIDKWDDHHNMEEYHQSLVRLPDAFVLRASFSECLQLFNDKFFDFIFIDGYAHTGQDGGNTLRDWYPKLKKGGIFSGHDYDYKNWPKTYHEVNKFCEEKMKTLNIINEEPYNSWWIRK